MLVVLFPDNELLHHLQLANFSPNMAEKVTIHNIPRVEMQLNLFLLTYADGSLQLVSHDLAFTPMLLLGNLANTK